MPEPASGPPTKTIIGPDGNPIHYPDLPGVGESYHKPDPPSLDNSAQRIEPSPETAPVASQSSNESLRERVMSAARSAIEKAGAVGHTAAQAFFLDDWKTLTDSHSTPLQRVEGGADLASWAIPEGKIAEFAGHAVAKAAEVAAAHLTASDVEHLGEAAVATAAFRSTARPLTDAERSGHFKSAQDFKDFMGPATESGGPKRDWHHIVEKTHADKTGKFAWPDDSFCRRYP